SRMLARWRDGQVPRRPPANEPEIRPQHDGLLHEGRLAVLPRAGRKLHALRPLPLLGARAHGPEPHLLDVGDDRSQRDGWTVSVDTGLQTPGILRHVHVADVPGA